jgi:hypothetical protein
MILLQESSQRPKRLNWKGGFFLGNSAQPLAGQGREADERKNSKIKSAENEFL